MSTKKRGGRIRRAAAAVPPTAKNVARARVVRKAATRTKRTEARTKRRETRTADRVRRDVRREKAAAFRDVIREETPAKAAPIDRFLRDLDGIIATTLRTKDRVFPAIATGKAPLAVVKQVAKEFYYLGRWMTPDFAVFVANAPDRWSLSMDHSEHYAHWMQNLADEAGYLRDPNHVQMKLDWCRQLGISDRELEAYVPLPETIGMTFTMLYYVRRSYEEGLAVFGYAGERRAAKTGYAKVLYEGLKTHYGLDVQNFAIHAYAEDDHGDKAEALLRKVALTADVQHRIREAVRHCMLVTEMRQQAFNRLMEGRG